MITGTFRMRHSLGAPYRTNDLSVLFGFGLLRQPGPRRVRRRSIRQNRALEVCEMIIGTFRMRHSLGAPYRTNDLSVLFGLGLIRHLGPRSVRRRSYRQNRPLEECELIIGTFRLLHSPAALYLT